MRKPHTACHPGKRVRVVLRDGRKFDDWFVDRTNRWVLLRRAGKLNMKDLKAFIILKGT